MKTTLRILTVAFVTALAFTGCDRSMNNSSDYQTNSSSMSSMSDTNMNNGMNGGMNNGMMNTNSGMTMTNQ